MLDYNIPPIISNHSNHNLVKSVDFVIMMLDDTNYTLEKTNF